MPNKVKIGNNNKSNCIMYSIMVVEVIEIIAKIIVIPMNKEQRF